MLIFEMHEDLFYYYLPRTVSVCKFPQGHNFQIKFIVMMVDAQIRFQNHKRALLLIFSLSSPLRDLSKGFILIKKRVFLAKNAYFLNFEGVYTLKNASVGLQNTLSVFSDPKLTCNCEILLWNALFPIQCLIRWTGTYFEPFVSV